MFSFLLRKVDRKTLVSFDHAGRSATRLRLPLGPAAPGEPTLFFSPVIAVDSQLSSFQQAGLVQACWATWNGLYMLPEKGRAAPPHQSQNTLQMRAIIIIVYVKLFTSAAGVLGAVGDVSRDLERAAPWPCLAQRLMFRHASAGGAWWCGPPRSCTSTATWRR